MECEEIGIRIRLGFGLPQVAAAYINYNYINFAFHFPSSSQLPSVEMLRFWLSEATATLP